MKRPRIAVPLWFVVAMLIAVAAMSALTVLVAMHVDPGTDAVNIR